MKLSDITTTITPALAADLLNKNTINRPITKSKVDTFAREMAAGKFRCNGETICLNGDFVLDGQHRLLGCVQSGCAFDTVLVEDVPLDCFPTFDTGTSRTGGDVLAARRDQNAGTLAGAISYLRRIENGFVNCRRMTNREIIEFADSHSDLKDVVAWTVTTAKESEVNLVSPGAMAAVYYLFRRVDEAAAQEFIRKLVTRMNVENGTSISLLIDRLTKNRLSAAKLNSRALFGLIIKAWNNRGGSGRMKRLCFHTRVDGTTQREAFPEIV